MSTFNWLVIGFLAIAYMVNLISSLRCERHGGFGRCRRCDEDAAAKSRAEAKERAEAERKRLDVTEIFQNMDEKLRAELTAIVTERVERLHLLPGPDGLEAAVVKLYRKRQHRRE